MSIDIIKKELLKDEYAFLKENEHLNNNVILLALGGSHAYGMNKETSDLDLRGISLNSKQEVLLGQDFDQVVDIKTDTVIYSVNKMLYLLERNNPNTLEILGVKPEHYLYANDIGRLIVENRKIFLSKVCIHTFGGYASSQLRRLENKSARLTSQAEQEAHIMQSIENASFEFKNRYMKYDAEEYIRLYLDDSEQEDMDKEIFMDICLKHYPLRDWVDMWSEMKSIVRSYEKVGKRNEKAMSHDKLGKHMAHLMRLYMMCIDILTKEEVITYREDEHDLLMSIRNGEYLDENRQPTKDFFDILNDYQKKLDYAKANTSLPDTPNKKAIDELKIYINEKIVKGCI